MPLDIQPFTHAPLHWSDGLPAVFDGPRLPGSAAMHSQGGFGTIALQEVNTAHYSIRYLVIIVLEQLGMRMRAGEGEWHAPLSLNGNSLIQVNGDPALQLQERQFVLLDMPSPEITAEYKPGTEYHYFDTSLANEGAGEIRELFRERDDALNVKRTLQPVDANPRTFEIVRDILHCNYANALLLYYFRIRVTELFLQYLLQWQVGNSVGNSYRPSKIDAVRSAEQLITSDLSRHLSLRQLCKKTGLNEYDLKYLFRQVYGMGPYEYLLSRRMHHARILLEKGEPVKVVAISIGMQPSYFSVAFKKFFGFNASQLMK